MEEMMVDKPKAIAYGHDSHRKFNERFLPEARASPGRDVVSGPWLSNAAAARLPSVQRDFDQSRDPFIAEQVRDLKRTETERREEQAGRGSAMVKQDQPIASLKPPREIGREADAQRFRARWLAEQRAAAMEHHRSDADQGHKQHLPTHKYRLPGR
jgi:hypothetical protein